MFLPFVSGFAVFSSWSDKKLSNALVHYHTLTKPPAVLLYSYVLVMLV
jgi:hypothetical protein